MNFTTRQLVTLTVFGALWGVVEMSLGSLFHSLNLPFSGSLLAAVGLAIALIGRLFVPTRGSTFYIGVVAMVLKLFSIGSIKMGPMIGILAEAALAELVLSARGRPSRAAFMLAGGLGVLWTLFQPFATGLLLFGRDILDVWGGVIEDGSQLLGLEPGIAFWIFLALALIQLLIGGLGGWLAWDAGRRLFDRLEGVILLPSRP